MKNLDNLYKLTIGDYWNDGHGRFVTQQFLTNVTSEQMKKAYWDSCKLVGIQFHTNGNATGLPDWEHKNHRDFRVLNGYRDSSISKEAMRKMKEHGLLAITLIASNPMWKIVQSIGHGKICSLHMETKKYQQKKISSI